MRLLSVLRREKYETCTWMRLCLLMFFFAGSNQGASPMTYKTRKELQRAPRRVVAKSRAAYVKLPQCSCPHPFSLKKQRNRYTDCLLRFS